MAASLAGPSDAAAPFRDASLKRAVPAQRPAPGKLPRGPVQIIVSISRQSVSVYVGGMFVARSPISTGVREHPTPTGVFTVLQKHKWHRSNIYSLAPMPYMQRITWSGVALHAGVLPGYPASHGCIRMPDGFAQQLWAITRTGARVIVAQEETAPADITHPRLFSARPMREPQASGVVAPPQADPADPAAAMQRTVVRATNAVKIDGAANAVDPAPSPAVTPRRSGNVSVLISRKAGKLFVRRNYMPLFEAPITIKDPGRPLGTHVYTAMAITQDGTSTRWTAITMPGERAKTEVSLPRGTKSRREARHEIITPAPAKAALEALDRIEIPQDVIERISEILTPGSSLIISDQAISEETGDETDFIILTR